MNIDASMTCSHHPNYLLRPCEAPSLRSLFVQQNFLVDLLTDSMFDPQLCISKTDLSALAAKRQKYLFRPLYNLLIFC